MDNKIELILFNKIVELEERIEKLENNIIDIELENEEEDGDIYSDY